MMNASVQGSCRAYDKQSASIIDGLHLLEKGGIAYVAYIAVTCFKNESHRGLVSVFGGGCRDLQFAEGKRLTGSRRDDRIEF